MKPDVIVRVLHLLVIFFFIAAPFTHNCELIIMHAVLVPFLYFHWITNNDTCALTELEKFMCNKKENLDTFIGSVVSPVYKIQNSDVKILTLLLWVFSLSQAMNCSKTLWRKFLEPLRIMKNISFKR